MATFEEALPGLQAQGYGNVMDALAAYNAANQASYFGTPNTYPAPSTSFDPSQYADTISQNKINKLEKFQDIVSGGGTLSKQQEAKLGKISGLVGADLASQIGYTPLTEKYENKYTKFSDYGLPSALPSSVADLYQTVLGRDPIKTNDQAGYDYWSQKFGPTIQPWEYEEFYKAAAPELVSQAYQTVLNRDITSPEDYWVQQLQNKALPSDELRKSIAYGASSLADQLAAQQYLNQNIFGTPEDLRSRYQTSFNQTIQDVFGTSDVSQLATSLGTTPEKLNYLDPSQYETSSISDIRKTLQQSDANRYQEANQLFKLLPTVFGLSPEEALKTTQSLYSGQSDGAFKDIYNDLLTQGLSPEVQNKILSQAAVSNPNSPYFKANPDKLAIYTPLSTKEAPGAPGQYGYSNNAPILSAKEADKLLGGEVIKGGNNYFGYGGEGKKDDALGWDLRSKYAGAIANGAGIFGVNATSKDISDFDKIEKEIQKLGGIKTERDAEGNVRQVVYKDVMDPESGRTVKQAVDARSLFATGNDEYSDGGYDKYKTYQQTKDALEKGAEQLKIDPSQFSSVKGLFDAVNDKSQNLYVVTGKANKWDPAAAEAQGITGVGRDRGGVNHAQVLYQKVGDKLMPVQTLKTFNFDDPNTTSGFFGDIAQGIGSIMSIPPIQLAFAMAGGWPALFERTLGTDLAVNAASKLAGSIGSAVAPEIQDVTLQNLIGKSLLNAGTSALSTGLFTGDLGKAGIAGLAGGIGAGVSGGLPMLLGDVAKDLSISPGALKVASEIAGGAAATGITGQDAGSYALNRLLSTGIGALTAMGAKEAGIPTTGPGADLFKAMVPIITSKQVRPEDVTRLAAAVNAYQKTT